MLKTFLSIFFPFKCHVCSSETDWGRVLCPNCGQSFSGSLEDIKRVVDVKTDVPIYTLSSYSSDLSELVKIIKYKPSKKLLNEVCLLIESKQIKLAEMNQIDVFVPVPLHQKRLATRGFNQAEILAKLFAKMCGANYSNALIRVLNTKPQARCNEKERLTNLNGAFKLNDTLIFDAFREKRICLVDDVATTGTTIALCTEIIQNLKPASVSALVLSHSFKKI